MDWTDETILSLRALWDQGLSTAEIGRRLGVTKNAVVGKAHRLVLSARPSPIRRDRVVIAAGQAIQAPRLAVVPVSSVAPDPDMLPMLAAPEVGVVVREEPPASLAPPDESAWPAWVRPSPVPAGPVAATALRLSETSPLASRVEASPRLVVEPVSRPVALRSAPGSRRSRVVACCWPIGEPGSRSFRFCDAQSMAGKPYCETHAQLAYVKVRDRRDDAA